MKKCPSCNQEIQELAKKCRHCWEWIKETTSKIEDIWEYAPSKYSEEVPSLPQHYYPIHIKFLGLVFLWLFFYSLYPLPAYFEAAHNLRLAEESVSIGNYDRAIEGLSSVLSSNPSSSEAKILIAESYFWNSDKEDDQKWMDYLEGLTLDKNDWQKLSRTMPKEYEQYFNSVKK